MNGYKFVSGINNGRIPTFEHGGRELRYRVPSMHSQVNLAIANLFGCRMHDATIADGEQCGFGIKHTR